VGGEKSSVEQIKEKWRKACSTAKLEAAVNRKSLNQTGGGPALPAPSGVTQTNLGTSHRCTKDISVSPITARSESARRFDNRTENSRKILDWLINNGIIT
jgi:hypothetical protein